MTTTDNEEIVALVEDEVQIKTFSCLHVDCHQEFADRSAMLDHFLAFHDHRLGLVLRNLFQGTYYQFLVSSYFVMNY